MYGHLTLRYLAVLAEEWCDWAEARQLWRLVLDVCAESRTPPRPPRSFPKFFEQTFDPAIALMRPFPEQEGPPHTARHTVGPAQVCEAGSIRPNTARSYRSTGHGSVNSRRVMWALSESEYVPSALAST